MILEIGDYPIPDRNGLGVSFNYAIWEMVRHRHLYQRFFVNLASKPTNPYHSPEHGPNPWSFYFDQPEPSEPTVRAVPEHDLDLALSGHRAWDVAHQRAISPFAREYVRLRPEIQAEVDSFKAQFFKGRVLGLAVRSTDKGTEYRPMTPAELCRDAEQLLTRLSVDTLFLSTDGSDVLNTLRRFNPVFLPIERSRRSLHHHPPAGPYESGKSAVMDGALLASCRFMFYTPSNFATLGLIQGQHEEIGRLTTSCRIEPFCPRVDRALGIGQKEA